MRDHRCRIRRGGSALGLLLIALAFSGCVRLQPGPPPMPRAAYVADDDGSLLARYAPIFVLEDSRPDFNRIGTPSIHVEDDRDEHVHVDPDHPALYGEVVEFETARGRYTNLVYRVHMPRVPYFHLTAGRNVGLLAIVTLDAAMRPVLITTVHTCGCYKAFVPTTYLTREAWPKDWNPASQNVYGETLPGLLPYPETFDPSLRPVFLVRSEIHRIMDVRLIDVKETDWRFNVIPTPIEPMAALDRLPMDGGMTTFFTQSGWRKGFVKESYKPLELLFMSWLALDPNIGCDKEYGPHEEVGTHFYTSLKPWRRDESDLWEFARCLAYWGWQL